jgi:hypothetical protein
MPAIIEYATVLQRMTAGGFHCNYPNSGAFGFAPNVRPMIRAWIGAVDVTIKPALLAMVKAVLTAVGGESGRRVHAPAARRAAGRGVGDADESLAL